MDFIVTSLPFLAQVDYLADNWLKFWFLNISKEEFKDNLIQTEKGKQAKSEINLGELISNLDVWISNSGIQNREGIHLGSFNSWYESDQEKYSYIYPEITGYGITTLIFLNHMKKAKLAADWIINTAMYKFDDYSAGVRTSFVNDDEKQRELRNVDIETYFHFSTA